MIWDLLHIACSSSARRKNVGLDKFPRENTYVHLSSEEMRGKTLFDELNDARENLQYDDENIGVSVVLIENNSFTDDFRRE